jgi:hypothetical protein
VYIFVMFCSDFLLRFLLVNVTFGGVYLMQFDGKLSQTLFNLRLLFLRFVVNEIRCVLRMVKIGFSIFLLFMILRVLSCMYFRFRFRFIFADLVFLRTTKFDVCCVCLQKTLTNNNKIFIERNKR